MIFKVFIPCVQSNRIRRKSIQHSIRQNVNWSGAPIPLYSPPPTHTRMCSAILRPIRATSLSSSQMARHHSLYGAEVQQQVPGYCRPSGKAGVSSSCCFLSFLAVLCTCAKASVLPSYLAASGEATILAVSSWTLVR